MTEHDPTTRADSLLFLGEDIGMGLAVSGNPFHGVNRQRGRIAMEIGTFDKPVRIQVGRVDRDRFVSGTRQAAHILLHEWPATDSQQRQSAMKACLEVIKGTKSAGHARIAFVLAARSAGLLLEESNEA